MSPELSDRNGATRADGGVAAPGRRPGRPPAWSVAAAAGIGLAVLAGACGGSSAPSKASYDKQANATCRSYHKELTALGSNLGKAKTTAAQEAVLNQAAAEAEAGTKKLEGLARPKGSSPGLTQAFGLQEQEVSDIKKLEQAVATQSSARAKAALADGNSASAKADKLFDAQGLSSCGSAGSS